jgi:hypothetical protein
MTRSARVTSPICLLVIAVSVFLTGCTYRVGDLTLLSTKNIDLSNAKLNAAEGQRFKGQNCVPVVFVPLGLPSLQEATDEALEKGNGNVMVDQVTTVTSGGFIFGVSCIESEGTVLNIASAPQ